jgi:hypothetical protein
MPDNEKTAMLLDVLAALDLGTGAGWLRSGGRWPRPSPGCLIVNSVH